MKPSERDPGAAMILAELAKEAAFPPGVINIVHGTTRAVDYIIDEPAIKAISVGSNRAGEYIYTCGSANGKRVQANLSAKNHAALLPDCNKNHALNAITPLLVQLVSAIWGLLLLESKKRIEDLITSAEEEGVTILLDGRGCKPEKYPNGNFVGPTIVTDVTPDMKCH
ncbi:hypothetical protein EYZ11_006198 [Aspergillus tanneri]|uniref:Aldehyde dehydrogenase domain-containing protein n=1 Tax=Aspergillus tanneri TaxID=1220188 RepID=A0A4S3JGE2_9EURO|nr:hypothetical protein EYZ11_006198 [Aspergillus tanneri]